MRNPYRIPPWKTAPFFRLLLPFMAGIILQWYIHFQLSYIIICITCFSVAAFLIYFLPTPVRYLLKLIPGVLIHCIITAIAMLITWYNDPRNQPAWYGNYESNNFLIIRINEPLVAKANSYKSTGIVKRIINGQEVIQTKGKLMLYFSKDSLPPSLKYDNYILVQKRPQSIKNSGNPGAFDYKQYASFQQVFHQVFLKKDDWKLLPVVSSVTLHGSLLSARESVLKLLKRFINGKEELAIAEALLIGYKEDLDKDLVQAYSNTGVVHIIAISGLHLGLIYFMLSWILSRIPFIKRSIHLKSFLLITSLWLFSLLTGGAASVLRSAVMFTTIVIGQSYFKKSSIYNSLCSSAFILLCFNPYFLWDVGFQLSYLAICGIVAIQEPVYRMLYIKNKWINKVWQMASVTISAQLMTFPVCLYYFHQFPVMFLFTNMIAVPLSTLILFSEIFLIVFSWIPLLATYAGKCIAWMIQLMNKIIRVFNDLPYSVLEDIHADLFTTCLLYGMILFLCGWFLFKNKFLLKLSITALLFFTAMHVYSKMIVMQQKRIIVYNIPHHTAVDFIYQADYFFYGSVLDENGPLQNYHLKPARIAYQLHTRKDSIKGLVHNEVLWKFGNKKLMIVNSSAIFEPLVQKINVDVLLITKNPKINLASLMSAIQPSVVVFDASNSLWKIEQWKKECELLLLPCFSVPEKGAFVLNVE